MIDVVYVESISNKSTTWHFKKIKEAYKFFRMIKKQYKKGYFVLCVDVK